MTDDSAAGARYYNAMDGLIRGMCPQADPDTPVMPVIMALTPWMIDLRTRTNRQVHEEAAGMNLEDSFFRMNGIDPDAIHIEEEPARYKEPIWSKAKGHWDAFVHCIDASEEFVPGSPLWFELRHQAHIERQEFQKLGHDICAPVGWELDQYWPNKAPK